MADPKDKKTQSNPPKNKLLSGVAKYAKSNYDVGELTQDQLEQRLLKEPKYYEKVQKAMYEKEGKDEFESYEDFRDYYNEKFGNPFESKKKDNSTTGSQGGTGGLGSGASEKQNTSKTEKQQAPNPDLTVLNEAERKEKELAKANEFNQKAQNANYDELFMGKTPEGFQPTSQISAEQNQQMMSGKVDAQKQQSIQADKQTVQPTNPTLEKEKAALKTSQQYKEAIASNPVKQADYFLGERDGYSVTGSFETDGIQKGVVDMNLNPDPTAPETEQQQVFTKLMSQNSQYLRDTDRGSNVDYMISKDKEGDYSQKDKFKNFQSAYSTRVNALDAKTKELGKDPAFAQKYQAFVQAQESQDMETYNALAQDPQIIEFTEATNQLTQLNKLTSDPNFIKSQFGEEVGKEYLDDIVAQNKANEDFKKANSKEGSYADFYVDSTKNALKQVGYATADFLTGVASLPRMAGSSSEYGLGDVVADWANNLNEDFKATFPEPIQISQAIFKNKVDEKGNAVLDKEGKIVEETNWEILPYKLVRAATDLGLQIAGTKGLNSIKGFSAIKGSSTIGMGMMSFTQTYNQSFQQALAKGASRENAETFAVTNAAMTAGLEGIAPNTWATKGIGASDNLFASMVKNGFTPSASKAFAKEFVKETAGEITEEISQGISSKMLESSMQIDQFKQKLDSDQTFEQEMKETALITFFLGGGMGIGAGKQKYSQMNQLTKASALEIAINPAFTQQKVKEQFELQNIPASKQSELLQELDDIKEVHEALRDSDRRGIYVRNIIDLSLQRKDLEQKSFNSKLPDVIKNKIESEIAEIDLRLEEVVARNEKLTLPMQLAKSLSQETTIDEYQKATSNEVTPETTATQEPTTENVVREENNVDTTVQSAEQQKATEKQALKESVLTNVKELKSKRDKIWDNQFGILPDIKKMFKSKKSNQKVEDDLDNQDQAMYNEISQEFEKLTPLGNKMRELRDNASYDEYSDFYTQNKVEIYKENVEKAEAERDSELWEKESSEKDVENKKKEYEEVLKEAEAAKKNNPKVEDQKTESQTEPTPVVSESDVKNATQTESKQILSGQDKLLLEGYESQKQNIQNQLDNPRKKRSPNQQRAAEIDAEKRITVIDKKIEAINNAQQPQQKDTQQTSSFGDNPREIKINIAAATKRAIAEKTESTTWKDLQDSYRAKRSALDNAIASNASPTVIKEFQDSLDTKQTEMYEKGQELIKSFFERETGLKIKSIENAVGKFDKDVEPSHVITFEINNEAEFEKIDEIARQFSEATLQDAYIITQDLNDSDIKTVEEQTGKKIGKVLVSDNIDFGKRGMAKVVKSHTLSFNDALSQQEILEIEKKLSTLGLEEFTIGNDGKSIQFQLFSFKENPTDVIAEINEQLDSIEEFTNILTNDFRRTGRAISKNFLSFYRAADQLQEGRTERINKKRDGFEKVQERNYGIARGTKLPNPKSPSEIRKEAELKERLEIKKRIAGKKASQDLPPPKKSEPKSSEAKTDSNKLEPAPTKKSTFKELVATGKAFIGLKTELIFSRNQKPVEAYFGVVEADSTTASNTINGKINPEYNQAIQPKAWDENREEAAEGIKDSPRGNDLVGKGSDPYNGTPVVDEDLHSIQGNNRLVGLYRHYKEFGGKASYKEFLIGIAVEYGLDPVKLAAMENPILVRIVNTENIDPVKLGQSLAADRETGGQGDVTIVSAVNILNADKGSKGGRPPAITQIVELLNRESSKNSDGSLKSVAQLMQLTGTESDGSKKFVGAMLDILSAAQVVTNQQRKAMLTDGVINAKGMQVINDILTGSALARGSSKDGNIISATRMNEVLNAPAIPFVAKHVLDNNTIGLLASKEGLGSSLYNALTLYLEYKKNGFKSLNDMLSILDTNGKTAVDKYGKDAVNLARFFDENKGLTDSSSNVKKQESVKAFQEFLKDYSAKLEGEQPTPFNPEGIPPMSQQDAATAASAKLLQDNPPQATPVSKKAPRERESRGTGRTNTEVEKAAVKTMVDRMKKSFPKIKVSQDENLTNGNGDAIVAVFRDGEVVINPNLATMEDVMEEFTHVYLQVAQAINPTLLKEGERLVSKTEEGKRIMEEVKRDYADIGEKGQLNEAIAKMVARYGVGMKKPSIFTRFVDKIRNAVRTALRRISPEFYDNWIKTTNAINPGKMTLNEFSKAMAGDMLYESPLTYVTSEELSKHLNENNPDDKVQDITISRGLLQDPTRLDKVANKLKFWIKSGANVPKFVMKGIRSKKGRIAASQMDVSNNSYIFKKLVDENVKESFKDSNLPKKDLKAAKASHVTKLFQDANEVLHGRAVLDSLPVEMRSIVTTLRDSIDAYSKALIAEGIVPNDDLVGQFNEDLTVFLKNNFDAQLKIQDEVKNGTITQAEADAKINSMTATMVTTTKKDKKYNENDVDITITTADGKKHKFTGLNGKDIHYLFGKEDGDKIMNQQGDIPVKAATLFNNPLYARMMANIGIYVNRSYAIHTTNDLTDYMSGLKGSVKDSGKEFFARKMRNREVTNVKVQKMPLVAGEEQRFSLTFQNKYGYETESNQFQNLTLEEVNKYIDGDVKMNPETTRQAIEDVKAEIAELDKVNDADQIADLKEDLKALKEQQKLEDKNTQIKERFSERLKDKQTTTKFEFKPPRGFVSSDIGFSASASDVNAAVSTFLRTQMAKGKGKGNGVQTSQNQVQKNTGILQKKLDDTQLPKSLRDLMGENTDVITNYSNTILKMANMLETQKLVNKLWEEGGEAVFSTTPTATLTEPISAANNTAFAPLDGKFTTPEIAELLLGTKFEDGDGIMNQAYNYWLYLNGLVKANLTVFSQGSQMRNLIGGQIMASLTGSYNIADLPKAMEIVYEATRPGKHRDFYKKGLEKGVFSQNLDAQILKSQLERAKTEIRREQGKAKSKTQKVGESLDYVKKGAGKIYQFPDDMVKAAVMINEISLHKRAAEAVGKPITDDQAFDMAADNVNAMMANYGQTSIMMQNLSKNVLFGSFVMFTSEALRTKWNIMAIGWNEVRSKNPVYIKRGIRRMASNLFFSTASMSLAAISATAAFGIDLDDEEEKAIRLTFADYAQNSNLLWIGRNEPKIKGGTGTPRYLDLSYVDPSSQIHKILTAMWRGDGFEEKFAETLRETVSPFFGMEIFTSDAYKAIFNKDDFGRDIAPKGSGAYGVAKRASVGSQNLLPKITYEYAYLALGALNEFKGEKETKYQTYTRDILLKEEAMNTMLGVKTRTFDAPKRFESALYGLLNVKQNGDAFYKDRWALTRNIATTSETAKEGIADYKKDGAFTNYTKKAKEIYQVTKLMKKYGYSTDEIEKMGTEINGITKKMMQNIIDGNLDYNPFNEDKIRN